MFVIPAIDIKDGVCVRLRQGLKNEVTVYYDNPLEPAKMYKEAGFDRIHIVDLDGAFTGISQNIKIIEQIVRQTGLIVQTGGGIRSFAKAKQMFDAGVTNVITGTIAIEETDEFKKMADAYGEKIFVSIDSKNDFVTVKGWVEKTELKSADVIKNLSENYGINTFVWTDIEKDGMLSGIDTTSIEKVLSTIKNIKIIVSGGVSTIEDIEKSYRIKDLGVIGVISGKAIYEKKLSLSEIVKYK
jgi:phosphoribosylformimino-5-aminoimidazole carboxamide ribotide isomerase